MMPRALSSLHCFSLEGVSTDLPGLLYNKWSFSPAQIDDTKCFAQHLPIARSFFPLTNESKEVPKAE